MAKCIQCGSYTKFEKGLCYDCYSEKKGNGINKSNDSHDDLGLTDKEHYFKYNIIKGRIAETLIEELFLSLEYNVFRYGMENTIPGVMKLLKGVRSDVADDIKKMPDFVIQNPKNNSVYFVEVKFRASGEFGIKDLEKGKDYPYENAFIILVSKKHIKCLTYQELKDGKTFSSTSHNYLGNRKEFDLDKEVIKEFCDFAIQFFENV